MNMKKKRDNKTRDYGKKYFTRQFTAVGDFDTQALQRNVNWFQSQLSFFEDHFGLNFKSARSILEVGCAIGGIAHIFSNGKRGVYAVDISKFAVEKAKELSPSVNFAVCDIQKSVPIQKTFDYIFAFEVLEHLTDPYQGILNLKKKLGENGTLIITTPYPFPKYININTHVNVLEPRKWVSFFKKAGFKKVEYQPVTFIPYLYRLHPKLGLIIPFNSNLPYINSTVFYVAR